MKITPLGDSALTVQVRGEFESDPEGCLRAVSAVLRDLEAAHISGVRELVPAFTTVTVFYDLARMTEEGASIGQVFDWLSAKIKNELAGVGRDVEGELPPRELEIPVCYDTEFGPDLAAVAAHAKMSPADVIGAHSSAVYRVGCLGFTPGFPFLIGLPSALATPRRTTPRQHVAAGSVAIGGAQTGVYPQPSPGGWNVIGRTPLSLFDVNRASPALLQRGDVVRFRPLTRAEFDAAVE
jgi:inhibitor of KinA